MKIIISIVLSVLLLSLTVMYSFLSLGEPDTANVFIASLIAICDLIFLTIGLKKILYGSRSNTRRL